jgi:hypothetical protein
MPRGASPSHEAFFSFQFFSYVMSYRRCCEATCRTATRVTRLSLLSVSFTIEHSDSHKLWSLGQHLPQRSMVVPFHQRRMFYLCFCFLDLSFGSLDFFRQKCSLLKYLQRCTLPADSDDDDFRPVKSSASPRWTIYIPNSILAFAFLSL